MVVSEGTYPGTRVALPHDVERPFEVYVNGVQQREGADYVVRSGVLEFARSLASEGRLGAGRWTSMLLGIAGTYRADDSVDVVYSSGGRRKVAAKLPFEA